MIGRNKWVVVLGLTASLLISVRPSFGAKQDPSVVCFGGEDPDRVIASCERVVKTNPSPPIKAYAFAKLGFAHRLKNRLDAAIRFYTASIDTYPSDVGYTARGDAYHLSTKFQLAISDYSEALRLNPRYTEALAGRALSYSLQGDFDKAISDNTEAIKVDPAMFRAYYNRGVVYQDANDCSAAMRDFTAAIRIKPTLGEALINRAICHFDAKRHDLAFADADKAVELDPKAAYYAVRGGLHVRKGDFDRASTDLREAMRRDPQFPRSYFYLARVLAAKGDVDGALQNYGEAIRLRPDYMFTYEHRGRLLARLGKTEDAIADFNAAVSLRPNLTSAYLQRGQTYETLGELEKAKADYEQAATRAPAAYTEDADVVASTARERLAKLTGKAPQANDVKALPAKTSDGARLALVIGNGAYDRVPSLRNPSNDARQLVVVLRELGFRVIEGYDLGSTDLRGKIAEFGSALPGTEVALFYYAGHGLQVGGRNYLVPVDAKLERPSSIDTEAVDVGAVLSDMEAEKRVSLVFLDACRDNPFSRNLARSFGSSRSTAVGQGLAQINGGIGTLITFATSPDTVALDGDGTNSPFTEALLKHIRTPNLEIRSMLTRVRADVIKATRERQVPWDHSSLTGDFYFRPPG